MAICRTSAGRARTSRARSAADKPPWPQRVVVSSPTKYKELYCHRAILAEGVAPMPGAVELARACHAAGLRLGIASSSPLDQIEEIVEALGQRHLFDVLTSGHEVPRAKPDPAIYQLACVRLRVAPAECVALEDSRPGVLAARAAGLRCLAVPNVYTANQDLSAASAVVPTLAGVTPTALAAVLW